MTNDFKTIQFIITENTSGLRLDKALATHPEIASRSKASKLIHDNKVLLNNSPVKASHKTLSGECFQVELSAPEINNHLNPYDFPLEIMFEDEEIIVINKPSGLVVHPSAGHAQDTLVNALLYHSKTLSSGFEEMRPGIVHRLDKDTSGLIVVAKTDRAHAHLAEQFKSKTASRMYWALVFGTFKYHEGTYNSHLARHPNDRLKFSSVKIFNDEPPKGKRAITHYKLVETHSSGISLIECHLETGRTHQIRVHMSENHHPILGDSLYSGVQRGKNLKSTVLRPLVKNLGRVALHARQLGLNHPITENRLNFQAPLPENLRPLFNHLGFQKHDSSNFK